MMVCGTIIGLTMSKIGIDIQQKVGKKREYFTHDGVTYDITWESGNELIRHGGPWDRGSADSYYRRGANPHYYNGGSYNSTKVEESKMSPVQIQQYYAGFEHNEQMGDHKEW